MDELCLHRDDVCLFTLDETGIRLESTSFYGWAPVILSLLGTSEWAPQGVNVIGAREILKSYRPYYSIHSSWGGMK